MAQWWHEIPATVKVITVIIATALASSSFTAGMIFRGTPAEVQRLRLDNDSIWRTMERLQRRDSLQFNTLSRRLCRIEAQLDNDEIARRRCDRD